MLTSQQKQQIILHAGSEKNTGSTKVQILLATARINDLQQHFQTHRQDKHSRRGLLNIVSKRRKLLKYLKVTDPIEHALLTKKAVAHKE
jgi:small subunit ribosomal protein S15